jgi:hypothetical protein
MLPRFAMNVTVNEKVFVDSWQSDNSECPANKVGNNEIDEEGEKDEFMNNKIDDKVEKEKANGRLVSFFNGYYKYHTFKILI